MRRPLAVAVLVLNLFACIGILKTPSTVKAFSPSISASTGQRKSFSVRLLTAFPRDGDEIMATIGNDIRSRPNDCTYWVSTRFLAGEYPTFSYGTEQETRRKLGAYLDHGVRTFVDLTQQGEKQDYVDLLQEEATKRNIPNVQYHRISIPDFGIPSSKQVMKVVLDTIDRGMEEKDAGVYVHCRGGIGRTGTTVGCWLVRNAGLTGEAALAETNRLFQSSSRSRESSCSPETRDQMEFVRTWNED